MTPLRKKMIKDMQLRRFSPDTQKLYVYAVEDLARFFNRSPDRLSEQEVWEYLLRWTPMVRQPECQNKL